MQTERTLEQMNAAQQKTILELTQQVKQLRLEVEENAIWSRFAAYLISDCNMQEQVMEQWMADMLEKEKS